MWGGEGTGRKRGGAVLKDQVQGAAVGVGGRSGAEVTGGVTGWQQGGREDPRSWQGLVFSEVCVVRGSLNGVQVRGPTWTGGNPHSKEAPENARAQHRGTKSHQAAGGHAVGVSEDRKWVRTSETSDEITRAATCCSQGTQGAGCEGRPNTWMEAVVQQVSGPPPASLPGFGLSLFMCNELRWPLTCPWHCQPGPRVESVSNWPLCSQRT